MKQFRSRYHYAARITHVLLVLVLLLCSAGATAQTNKVSNVHVGLIYPISSNGKSAEEYTNHVSIHLLSGLSKSETGFIFSGIASVIKDSATGVQFAGIANTVLNSTRGTQFAGIGNYTKNAVEGFQGAGIFNKSNTVSGFQFAGIANITTKQAKGVQIAGIVSTAEKADVQVAGILNMAKKVKGVQFGFINIADSSDHAIGVLNFIKNGEKSIGVSIDETATTLISFRSGGRVWYGILGIGGNFSSGKSLLAWEAGLGVHWKLSPQFRINTELLSMRLDDFKTGDYNRYILRVMPAVRLGHAVEIFGGPTFNFVDFTHDKGNYLTHHYLWDKTSGNHFYGLYFGATGGIHVNLQAFQTTSNKHTN